MGITRHSLVAACLLVAAPLTTATAADFRFPPEPITQVPEPIAIPQGSTWYLRGDMAYSFAADPSLDQTGAVFGNGEMDDTFSFGGGFGHHFTANIRGDLTLDYRTDADVEGLDRGTGAMHSTELNSLIGLANIYYDIRPDEDFTPYLGVGLGFAWNETKSRSIAAGGVQTGSTAGSSDVSLAFAAMAGVSFRVRESLLIDTGYRFLHMGEGETDSANGIPALEIDDIQAHEFRIGLRYEFE